VGIRVVSPDDAEAFTDLLSRNRSFLAPWDPVRIAGRWQDHLLFQRLADGPT
jgi:hypothetical protein